MGQGGRALEPVVWPHSSLVCIPGALCAARSSPCAERDLAEARVWSGVQWCVRHMVSGQQLGSEPCARPVLEQWLLGSHAAFHKCL